jgi:hypothetical protein
MAIIVVILLLCVISLLIPVIYFTSQGVPLADIAGKVQEILPESSESSDDAAYKREMEKIKAESGEAGANLRVKQQDAGKKREEASQAEAEAVRAAQVFTKPEATQEEKNAAAAKLAEAAAAAESARQAEAEAEAEAERNREAQAQVQRDAQALATLKDGCKNVVWNNVFVDGRVGVDVAYANGKSISATPSTGLTKGNAKVTVTTANKTIFSKREQTGVGYRGVPEYGWRSKAEYDGIAKISGSKVGYIKMKKKPSSQQPSSCKSNRPRKYNCKFESDGFEELHDFNDTTKPLLLMHHKGYTGVMQGETGEFYSFQDKKVIGNPYSSDCQTKLDYK